MSRQMPEQIEWSPEAREMFAERMGVTLDQADATLKNEHQKMRAAWKAYIAAHPEGSLEEFLITWLLSTLDEMATGLNAL